jgi:hypothetical protein
VADRRAAFSLGSVCQRRTSGGSPSRNHATSFRISPPENGRTLPCTQGHESVIRGSTKPLELTGRRLPRRMHLAEIHVERIVSRVVASERNGATTKWSWER